MLRIKVSHLVCGRFVPAGEQDSQSRWRSQAICSRADAASVMRQLLNCLMRSLEFRPQTAKRRGGRDKAKYMELLPACRQKTGKQRLGSLDSGASYTLH